MWKVIGVGNRAAVRMALLGECSDDSDAAHRNVLNVKAGFTTGLVAYVETRVTHPSGNDPHHDGRRDHDTMHFCSHDAVVEQYSHCTDEKNEVYPWETFNGVSKRENVSDGLP